jgi:quercetin dioxygenase-like cupin family protein
VNRFEDARGVIQDVLGPVDAVTRITTLKGAVRGNHVHHETTQWTMVTKGRLLFAGHGGTVEVGAGGMLRHDPGEPHAWRAVEDSECLVFTKGPRSGDGYENDTERLKEPLL